jgi:uncharacterized protein (UPF0276 family)
VDGAGLGVADAAAVGVEAAVVAGVVVGVVEANPMKIGIGYRHEIAGWLATRPPGIDCLEFTAEHFYDSDPSRVAAALRPLDSDFSAFVHGLGLSLGTPGELDQARLERFAQVATLANADWVSEHIAFTRTEETDLGHLNPVPPTRESVKIMAAHACELAERCGKPLLLENITSHVRIQGDLSETEFLNRLCAAANCGLLLDVTNLFVNSRNHQFDPLRWLHEIEPARIRQLHIVGYSRRDDRYTDDHSQAVQPELLELAEAIIDYAKIEAIILERDADFPGGHGMSLEIVKLQKLRATN